MKTISGQIVSTKPLSLSKAAKVLSSFVTADTGASHAVSIYLRRASDSFNELVLFHKQLSSGRNRNKHQPLGVHNKTPKLSDPNPKEIEWFLTGEDGAKKSEKKKKKRMPKVNSEVVDLGTIIDQNGLISNEVEVGAIIDGGVTKGFKNEISRVNSVVGGEDGFGKSEKKKNFELDPPDGEAEKSDKGEDDLRNGEKEKDLVVNSFEAEANGELERNVEHSEKRKEKRKRSDLDSKEAELGLEVENSLRKRHKKKITEEEAELGSKVEDSVRKRDKKKVTEVSLEGETGMNVEDGVKKRDKKKKKDTEDVERAGEGERKERKKRKSEKIDEDEVVDLLEQSGSKKRKKRRKIEDDH